LSGFFTIFLAEAIYTKLVVSIKFSHINISNAADGRRDSLQFIGYREVLEAVWALVDI